MKSEIQCEVIKRFSEIFRGQNFQNHVKQATENNITLFQPITNFFIPQYSRLPAKYFEQVKEYKTLTVLGMQRSAVIANKFTQELLLLECFKLLNDEVCLHYESETDSESVTKYFFLTFFIAAKVNFFKTFNVKVIIWKNKTSKVHGSVAGWRKNNSEPPKEVKSKYAEQLIKAVSQNKVKLDKITVMKDLENLKTISRESSDRPKFVQNTQNSSSARNNNRPRPNYRPNGPKEVRKQPKQQFSRSKNPKYFRNRDIGTETVENEPVPSSSTNQQ
ncbi:unnamed protein product [Orchesella dallaii]|uniref:Uncharacterized protein n=1 Tax=Orchesella dallaii TaxID=48710 RepID=A0ABP1PXE2_9HEXA